MDDTIAAALVQATARGLARGVALDAALAGTLRTPPPARRVQLFVGPPGDGKTSTIAKLAAQAGRAGRQVALVTTDTYRVGAVAELEAYGRALGASVSAAAGPGELRHALGRAAGADLVLVDTAGAGPGQAAELAELAVLAEVAGADASCMLVASAAAGRCTAWQTYRAFASLRPQACVLTKLDVGPVGPMLGVLWRRGVPVSHVAAGRRIPDDLEPATPERLARCLLAA
jgi:flagellar biosynthesis protein FlhF